jgi:hypothetical protein
MFTRLHECDSLFEDQVVSAATPEHIMQVGLGFWASKTLLSAVELGVFSTLADAPADLPTLKRKLALHQRSARDFLDALVALKLLERENGVYSNTADTDLFLDRAKPSYIGGVLEMANARLYGFWGSLTEALRTGEVQNENKGGGDKNVFAAVYADPDRLRPTPSPPTSHGATRRPSWILVQLRAWYPPLSPAPIPTSPASASTFPQSSPSSRNLLLTAG